MISWIHSYIQQSADSASQPNLAHHGPFYSVCQAMFYVFIYRNRELLADRKGNCSKPFKLFMNSFLLLSERKDCDLEKKFLTLFSHFACNFHGFVLFDTEKKDDVVSGAAYLSIKQIIFCVNFVNFRNEMHSKCQSADDSDLSAEPSQILPACDHQNLRVCCKVRQRKAVLG